MYTLPETNSSHLKIDGSKTRTFPLGALKGLFPGANCSDQLRETNSSHLPGSGAPKGKHHLPTIHFQVRAVGFREGNFFQCSPSQSRTMYPSNPRLSPSESQSKPTTWRARSPEGCENYDSTLAAKKSQKDAGPATDT